MINNVNNSLNFKNIYCTLDNILPETLSNYEKEAQQNDKQLIGLEFIQAIKTEDNYTVIWKAYYA